MQYDREKFADVVGSTFVLKGTDGRSIDVKLVEVTEAKERPRQVSYSMLFKAPENNSVEQGLYDLVHERLGELQLFLVPVGQGPDGSTLEAVINIISDESRSAS